MINWDEFEHIHVIKKLKHVLQAWWNIDIVFTDERGHLKGFESDKTSFSNTASKHLLSKESASTQLAETVSKAIEEMRSSDARYSICRWDIAGYDIGIFPILIDNNFMGSVVALGFIKGADEAGRLSEIRERLAAFGVSSDMIEQSLTKVRCMATHEKQHFLQN